LTFVRTLAQMRTSVQTLGRYERSNDITPAVLLEVINGSLVESYDLILGKWDDYYVKVGSTFPTVVGQESYALPTDFYKLRLVEVQDGSRWIPLLPIALDEFGRRQGSAVVSKRYRYRVATGSLYLSPPPATTADTLRVWYFPIAPQVASDTDTVTFDTPQEYKLFVHVALRDCRVREDLPTDQLDAKIVEMTKSLRAAADGHDAAEPFYLSKLGPGATYDEDDEGWFY